MEKNPTLVSIPMKLSLMVPPSKEVLFAVKKAMISLLSTPLPSPSVSKPSVES
jgi:hypothetical protein